MFWWGEARNFYPIGKKGFITVWKTYDNTCYIIPGKYYGLIKPISINYIKTTNRSDLDIIWNSDSSILVGSTEKMEIVEKDNNGIKIIDYDANESHNDSLYTYVDRNYRKFKNSTEFISVYLPDNYAWDKNGIKL